MNIREKTLTHLGNVLPKVVIKDTPVKQLSTVDKDLIKSIECPVLTIKSFWVLMQLQSVTDTAELQKHESFQEITDSVQNLQKTLGIWLKVLENNERARQ